MSDVEITEVVYVDEVPEAIRRAAFQAAVVAFGASLRDAGYVFLEPVGALDAMEWELDGVMAKYEAAAPPRPN